MGWTQSEYRVATNVYFSPSLCLFCPGVSLVSVRLSDIDVFHMKQTPHTCWLFTLADSRSMTQSVKHILRQTHTDTHDSSCSLFPVDSWSVHAHTQKTLACIHISICCTARVGDVFFNCSVI